jgi:hypothetical protein
MSIFLIMAALASNPADAPTCERLSAREVSSLVKLARQPGFTGDWYFGDLVKYWQRTCPDDRFSASKRTVKELSGLLQGRIPLVSLMLLDVGPNLPAARRDVDAAIPGQIAHEDHLMKASAPIAPENGMGLAKLLKCVRHKMDTGERDPMLCWATYAAY